MRKFLTVLLVLLLDLAVSVGGIFVYRAVLSKKQTESPTTQVQALHAAKNPYEDPNDPNTTKDGTVFSVGEMTGYFMEIKLTKQSSGMIKKSCNELRYDWCGKTIWSNKTHAATAILTFVDVQYNGQPIFVSVFTKVYYELDFGQMYPRLWAQEDFTEANDNAIRLPASYYNYLQYEIANKGASLRRFNLTFAKNEGKDVMPLEYTQEVDVRLYTKNIPADSDDPTSPNFKLDNWAGIMSALKNATGCGCSVSDVPRWVWYVVGILGFIFLIGLLRWAFGGRK